MRLVYYLTSKTLNNKEYIEHHPGNYNNQLKSIDHYYNVDNFY